MKHVLFPVSALLALASTAIAQYPTQGFMFNWDRPALGAAVSLVTRFATTAEENLTRYDFDDYRSWGINAAGQVEIRGYLVELQDDNDATRENYNLVGYEEDPANPNFPLLTAQRLNITNIPMPPTGNPPGGVFWRVGGTFTAPVTFASGTDLFLGVGLLAMTNPNPPYDGLWVATVGNHVVVAGVTTYDVPGPRGQLGGGIFRENYSLYVRNGAPLYVPGTATSLSQFAMDWMVGGGGIGGVALAQTNQTTYTNSNAPLSTSNFLSGLHPDVNGLNPGRADDIGFGVTTHTTQMPVGSPVFVLLAFGPSPVGNIPITSFPGVDQVNSGGQVCIDFTTAASFLAVTSPGVIGVFSEAQVIVPLNAQARAVLAGWGGTFDLWWQAVALDVTSTGSGAEVRTTGCAIQHLK